MWIYTTYVRTCACLYCLRIGNLAHWSWTGIGVSEWPVKSECSLVCREGIVMKMLKELKSFN